MKQERFSEEPESLTEAWADEGGRRWAAVADRLEAQLEPVDDILLGRAALGVGDNVLDVGCGRGVTTRRAAETVGPDGTVTGLDVAANLIDEARTVAHDGAPVEWVVGDGQRVELPSGPYDVVISRFGALFFDDPVTAFANLARATRPGGRLVVAVWQPRDRSDVLQRSLDVAAHAAAARGHPVELPPPDTGPFAFGLPEVALDLLARSGWDEAAIEPLNVEMYVCGPGTVEEVVDIGFTFGPLQRALADAPDDVVDAVRAAVADDLRPLHDGTGVKLSGAIAILTGHRPVAAPEGD